MANDIVVGSTPIDDCRAGATQVSKVMSGATEVWSPSGPTPVTIDASVRLDGSANISKTFASAGNRKKWTLSLWKKTTSLANTDKYVFAANGANDYIINRDTYQQYYFNGTSVTGYSEIADPSGHQHLLICADSDATAQVDRFSIYINGVLRHDGTDFGVGSGYEFGVFAAALHVLGHYTSSGGSWQGYLADTYLISGQALAPTAFGEFNSYGQWSYIDFTGTLGANDHHLKYGNSGNYGENSASGGDWTGTGFATTDQMLDTPTNNYAILNAISTDVGTLSNGNLSSTGACRGTFNSELIGSYWEVLSGGSLTAGVISEDGTANTTSVASGKLYGIRLSQAGALDYINITDSGSWTSITTGLSGSQFPYCIGASSVWNFGQDSTNVSTSHSDGNGEGTFAGTVPSGFLALCHANLPDATVTPSNGFAAVERAGTGATNDIDSLTFQGSLAWLKNRDAADSHTLFDSERGATKYIESDTSDVETTDTNSLTAFNSDGYSVGTSAAVNTSGEDYIDWIFRAGSAYGFDVIEGNGTTSESHGLGVVPELAIATQIGGSTRYVYHKDVTTMAQYLALDTTAAVASGGTWTVTSSNFAYSSLSGDWVAYLFASIPGYCKVGSYEGNGNANGTFIDCGFKVGWLLIKRTDSTGQWLLRDSSRDTHNVTDATVFADSSAAETSELDIDLVANGFKVRDTDTDVNASSGDYIYIAIAEYPFKGAPAS